MQEEQNKRKKIIIAVVVVLVLILAGFVFFFSAKNDGGGPITSIGGLFGSIGIDTPRPSTTINPENGQLGGTPSVDTPEPLFRQLSFIPTAGATTLVRNEKTIVRYLARENGFIYEVDPKTGASFLLVNTTIPRVYEAYWANKGNTVLLRYLTIDPLSKKEIIKTYLANLVLPIDASASTTPGSLLGDFLPDDILRVSVAPDGEKLFYLLRTNEGVSGTIVTLQTKEAKEVFRHSFSEWLPELLNDGNLILTTKPSAGVVGYSYFYDTTKKTLERILREKKGLTTLANQTGKRVLFSENVINNTLLGYYDEEGFVFDEGFVNHTPSLQLATLPEKCVWAKNNVRIFCGAFASTPRASIPDDWYRGVLPFKDTFWSANTDTTELTLLADPEVEIQKTFDVISPFIGDDEDYFFFTNKNDATLWSMRILKEKYLQGDQEEEGEESYELTPDEEKDAQGSIDAGI